MAVSQNGWPALEAGSRILYTWTIPARTGVIRVKLRNGSAGFLLVHFMLWFAEVIEPLAGPMLDDWGWAWRPIRGQRSGLSNHAAGCAVDLNATQHGLGKNGTFTRTEAAAIRLRLLIYRGAVRWGGDYRGRKDEMHVEVVASLAAAEVIARRLMGTKRGRRILDANPTQRAVILS